MTEDVVNKPKHYIPEDPAYECVKVAEAWGIDKDAYLFNVLKYLCRAGKKDPAKEIQDLEKAEFFLKRRIQNLKKQQEKEAKARIEREDKVATDLLKAIITAASNGTLRGVMR